jgi:hypothetical protein
MDTPYFSSDVMGWHPWWQMRFDHHADNGTVFPHLFHDISEHQSLARVILGAVSMAAIDRVNSMPVSSTAVGGW